MECSSLANQTLEQLLTPILSQLTLANAHHPVKVLVVDSDGRLKWNDRLGIAVTFSFAGAVVPTPFPV